MKKLKSRFISFIAMVIFLLAMTANAYADVAPDPPAVPNNTLTIIFVIIAIVCLIVAIIFAVIRKKK